MSGLEVTNNLVSDVREGVQTIKTNVNGPAEPKEAEVVQDVPADAPNRTGSA